MASVQRGRLRRDMLPAPEARFHTPYGVTSFRTTGPVTTGMTTTGPFPYALWRDLVSDDITTIYESADEE